MTLLSQVGACVTKPVFEKAPTHPTNKDQPEASQYKHAVFGAEPSARGVSCSDAPAENSPQGPLIRESVDKFAFWTVKRGHDNLGMQERESLILEKVTHAHAKSTCKSPQLAERAKAKQCICNQSGVVVAFAVVVWWGTSGKSWSGAQFTGRC